MVDSAAESSQRVLRSRRWGRIAVLQALYQIAFGGLNAHSALNNVLSEASYSDENVEFIRELVQGVVDRRTRIRHLIGQSLSPGWSVDRIAAVDLTILEIAAYELFYMPAMPPKATISEAVEIAKSYSTAESGRFVNGVLGGLFDLSPKLNWVPAENATREQPKQDDVEPEPSLEGAEETIVEGSEQYEALRKAGRWTVRSEPDPGSSLL